MCGVIFFFVKVCMVLCSRLRFLLRGNGCMWCNFMIGGKLIYGSVCSVFGFGVMYNVVVVGWW